MDVALLSLGYKLGLNPKETRNKFSKLAEIPFESEKRFAATLNKIDNGATLVVKGAVETVLSFCSHMDSPSGRNRWMWIISTMRHWSWRKKATGSRAGL
jgi:magnesium-transporting ATPase (P-type)